MKFKNKPFLIFSLIIVIVAFAYPQLKRHYIDPKKWMNATRNSIKAKALDVPMENIELYSKCLYYKFLKSYGKMENFPRISDYTKNDFEDAFDCTVEFIILDSIKKQEAYLKKDSIIKQMY